MRRKVFILGDSHATAIGEAVRARSASGADAASPLDIFASRFAKKKENGATIPGLSEAEAIAKLRAAKKTDILVSTLGGNQYNTLGLLEHPEPFDIIDPVTRGDPEPTTARIIPVAQMSLAFDDFVGGIRQPLERLKASFAGQVFHLNPPPPKSDNAYIKKNAEGYFRSEGKVVVNVSPPGMRRRLWLAQTAALARMCEGIDVSFLDVPEDSLDEAGFLKREAYGADATHANSVYGELVLRSLERLLAPAQEVGA